MINYANEEVKFTGCPGCAYGKKEFQLPCGIAYENEILTLSQDWELPIPGFFVVATKKHVETLEELTKEERDELFLVVDKTIKILRENKICDRFNVVFEEKRHFHIWIMPRHDWMFNITENIMDDIGKIFDYAINNLKTDKTFKEIDRITQIVKQVFKTKNISLYVPELKDYWYEEQVESDPESMSYNAGYDVSYYGYHYDTGCIDFPIDKWKNTYDKRINENKYYAYIVDNDLNKYVGYVNYHYNKNDDRYECGIVIESKYRGQGYSVPALKLLCEVAKNNGIKSLYDNFEIDRGNTLDIFKKVGFKVEQEQTWKKFDKTVKGVLVKIDL